MGLWPTNLGPLVVHFPELQASEEPAELLLLVEGWSVPA